MRKSRNLHQLLVVLFVFVFFILYVPSVCSDYYADIDIRVDDSGVVSINGKTNHPDLLAENSEWYTFKNQSYWLLNITKNEVFSDYIYALTLPQGSTINYIKSSGFRGIKEESGRLIITGSGGNESLSIVVQYQINNRSLDFNILLILGMLMLILVILLVFIIYQNKRKKLGDSDERLDNDIGYNFRGLTDRQKQIIELLIEAKRPLTQVEIEKELDIPKAAVSRNVHSLEIKSLIEIEKIGMSNLIRLKKP
jgi:uncharacterized membrane protein